MLAALLAGAVAAAAPGACHSSDLKLVYRGFQGAAGTGAEMFRLSPRSGIRCTLRGYPGVALLDARGRSVIHVGKLHDDLHPVRTLAFSHRRPARFDVRHPDFNSRTGKRCMQRIAAVQVIPPGETHALTLQFGHALRLCKAGARVTPVGRRY
jgi:hypothetical protein